jgi:small ligand-binding sensory domain FIST
VRDAFGTGFEFQILRDTGGKASGIDLTVENAGAKIQKSPVGAIKTTIGGRKGPVRSFDQIANAPTLPMKSLACLSRQ